MHQDVWVVILNYRGWDDTRACLQSLQGATSAGVHVIVVDNGGEEDRAAEMRNEFSWCTIIVSPENDGFSAGNNIGVRHAIERGAKWLLLLNNDMVVLPGLVDRLLERADAGFGILGPAVSFMEEPDVVMPTAFTFCPPGTTAVFERVTIPPGEVREVDVIMGCAMFISGDVFSEAGLLWPDYFLQHEETDYCLVAKARGWRVGALGEVLARHKGRSSFKREGMALYHYYDCRNLFLLARRLRMCSPGSGLARNLFGRATAHARFQYHAAVRDGRHDDAMAVSQAVWDAARRRFGRRIASDGNGARIVRLLITKGWRAQSAVERWLTRDSPRS